MSQNDTENRPTHERRTYTVDEIAEILDIGRTSAYKLVKRRWGCKGKGRRSINTYGGLMPYRFP